MPQVRDGRFSTELFELHQRSEQSLVATLAEMYLQGVSRSFFSLLSSVGSGFLVICCHHAAPTGRRARRSEMNRRMRAARLKFAVVLWQLWPMPIKYSGPLMHLKAYAIDGARLRTGKVLAGKYWVEDRTPISALNC